MRGQGVGAADEGGDGVVAGEGFGEGEGACSTASAEEEDSHCCCCGCCLFFTCSDVSCREVCMYDLEPNRWLLLSWSGASQLGAALAYSGSRGAFNVRRCVAIIY